MNSFQERLYHQVESHPDRRAIMFYDPRGDSSWETYGRLLAKAQGFAVRLADYGLRQGDVCVLVLPSEELCAYVLMGTVLSGAIPLLVAPPVLQSNEAHSALKEIVNSIVGRVEPRVVVHENSMTGMRKVLKDRHPQVHFVKEDELSPAEPTTFPLVAPKATDLAAMQLTSGTTGFPRICVWRQTNFLAALDGMQAAMQLNDDDICFNWTPLYHDMGLVNNFLLCLTSGVPLVMLRPHDFVRRPVTWLQGLHATRSTITWSPNFGYAITAQRVRDRELEGVRLDRVRAFWNAAERIHYETIRAFQERFAALGLRPEALKTNFGCAENVGGATFSSPTERYSVEHLDRALLQEKHVAQPVAERGENGHTVTVVGVGRPYPGMEIKILSPEGEFLPDGHVGEVALKTPSRMAGYLHDPEASSEAIRGELLLTGDLGYLRDGELFWVGRSRERIAVRGKKLDPSDFEAVLLKVAGLRHGSFAVFGVDDAKQGTQRVVVVAEVRRNTSRNAEEISADIRMLALERLGVNINELMLVQPNTLTKTSSGKRRHRYFRQLYLQGALQPFEWKGVEADSQVRERLSH